MPRLEWVCLVLGEITAIKVFSILRKYEKAKDLKSQNFLLLPYSHYRENNWVFLLIGVESLGSMQYIQGFMGAVTPLPYSKVEKIKSDVLQVGFSQVSTVYHEIS